MTDHAHRFEVKGSGLSCWAQCGCGEKLTGDAGPIVGSRAKVQAAIDRQAEQ